MLPFAGRPAEAVVVERVTRTAQEVVACRNAGDLLRHYALWTDDGLHQTIAESDDPADFAETLIRSVQNYPPSPLARDVLWRFVGVSDVRLLPDGRVGAVVEVETPDGRFSFFAIFARVGDRYLFDSEWYAVDEAGALATPAA
jgi:hypothetical protein